jgi:predicted nucleic acid-binding protein
MLTAMSSSFALDTNLLIYSVDSSDAAKQRIARDLVERQIGLCGKMPLQVLSEFYALTTRKRRLSSTDAARIVERALHSLEIISVSAADLIVAMRLNREHNMPHYDALLIATCLRIGCVTFLTEDLQHGRVIEGMAILNPFLLSPEERAAVSS